MAVLAAGVGLVAAMAPPASAAPPPTPAPSTKWTATPLTGGELVQGAKSPTGRLAQSDEGLLKSTSGATVNVMVKLDYDSYAAYQGGLEGLPATSPAKTGKSLDIKNSDAKKYEKHIEEVENGFLAELAKRVPNARAGQKLRTVYGGIALRVPANKAAELLKLPGVAAVQEDKPEHLLSDSSPAFIGAPTIYNKLGGSSSSGKGVIVGILDSGAWPEHPQFADPGTPARRTRHQGRQPAHLRLRGQPADPGGRPVRLQPQADRRRPVPRHLQRGVRRRGLPRQRT